eukprot:COSAG01_NODE_7387_length_3228_cov_17.737935_7_plen_65_part_00
MGSQKCRIVGKSQSAVMMINPIIITRTRIPIPTHCIVGSHHDNYCTSCVLVLRVRVETTGSQKI